MEAIEAILSRKSVAMLAAPAPSKEEIATLIQAAMRAPDHCNLRPWRFLVIENEAREDLGEIFGEALKKRDPDANEAMLSKARSKSLRAPLIITVIAKVEDHPKVPHIEQVLSAGAAAQNIMIAAHAMGYAGIWRSGKPCFDAHVRAALGAQEKDQIVGFLYLGTALKTPILRSEPISDYMENWTG
ncbi:MAG: NAD(P)H nitroreductase [Sneathiella sp.]|nr:MAG: NAD(P)H nitroreductase [Sneathiella sp.]